MVGRRGVVLLVVLALGGCEGNPDAEPTPVAVHSTTAPTPKGPQWWQPKPGEAGDWDWQISEPYDLSAPRRMYDLDLFDLAPAGSRLTYADGTAIELPA